MEYRRRRKTVYRPKHAGGYPAYFAVAAVFAGIVYCIAASRAATWVAEHWIAPALAPAAAAAEPFNKVEVQSGGEKENAPAQPAEARCELPAYACSALQIGVYENEANAREQAVALQRLGAAGHIVQDGARHRVLAAGYGDRASADAVMRQLAAEGIESCVYMLDCPAVAYTVSGGNGDGEMFAMALSAVTETLDGICRAAIEFDRQGGAPADGVVAVKALYDACAEQSGALHSVSSDAAGNVDALRSFYSTLMREMEQVYTRTDADTVAFSSMMKRLYLVSVEARLRLPNA